jgi:hypothetical protein
MSAFLASYARVSVKGLEQHWAEGKHTQTKFTTWAELGAGEPDASGLPPLRGRYFRVDSSPRFGRMDLLSKLGLGVAELCMAHAPVLTRQDVALVGGSMLGCLEADANYHDTLLKGGPTGASPAMFVYTLPSMFLGEIAIKFGLRGRTSYINAGKLSAIAALANGVRLIEKGRALAVLVVAAETAGPAARELDLKEQACSGACAWLLSAEGQSECAFSNVRYGVREGEILAVGEAGFGLTHIEALEQAMLRGRNMTVRCGEGADSISIEVSAIER